METDKLDELLEKITDYCFEYTYGEISFLKKEILFISDFFSVLDLTILPISTKNIQAQLENIKSSDDTFFETSEKLNDKVFTTIKAYKKLTEMDIREISFWKLLACFFSVEFEPNDLIIEYASYELLKLGISEDLIIEKLYKHFGDILSDNAPR
ncbi:hypothetical protein CKY20_10925 [Capnocytophaga canis]|uniref:Uncharacterized protein n=1 Tax=Capnocytophaga canis TaxID=1848903 RepID=A0A3A1YAH7_9FLAO|nr:hypothetical protein [Capnocytophaga canis]RIY35303.1 hypothetical protein CKY20_10925 [Capnocytophaga canis]